MRKFLQRLFFHTGFWLRTAGRLLWLLVRAKKLKIGQVGLDQAFYLEGSHVILEWEVENAWLIRVSHPGGFYHRSDHTWFTARPDMPPIRITIRGLGKKYRWEYKVLVRPYPGLPQSARIRSAMPATEAIHAGPRLSPRAKAISHQMLMLKPGFSLLPELPETASETAHDLQLIRKCQDQPEFEQLNIRLRAKYAAAPEIEHSSPHPHGQQQ